MHSCCKGRLGLVFVVGPCRIACCMLVANYIGDVKGMPMQYRLDLGLGKNLAQLASHYQKSQGHLPLEPALCILRPDATISKRRT